MERFIGNAASEESDDDETPGLNTAKNKNRNGNEPPGTKRPKVKTIMKTNCRDEKQNAGTKHRK